MSAIDHAKRSIHAQRLFPRCGPQETSELLHQRDVIQKEAPTCSRAASASSTSMCSLLIGSPIRRIGGQIENPAGAASAPAALHRAARNFERQAKPRQAAHLSEAQALAQKQTELKPHRCRFASPKRRRRRPGPRPQDGPSRRSSKPKPICSIAPRCRAGGGYATRKPGPCSGRPR